MSKWIARNSDNAWMVKGFGDPATILTNPASFTEVEVVGECPDPRNERYDTSAPSKRRIATAAEIAAYDDVILDAAVKYSIDNERLTSAIVWAIIDTYSGPATVAKYNAARTKIINAYKAQPWKA